MNIGRIERGLVVMGCVLGVVRGVLANIKRGYPERALLDGGKGGWVVPHPKQC